jgi:hypothetical protein
VRCEQRRPSHLLTKPNFTPQFTHPFTGELEQRFGRWRRGRRRCPRALPAARLQEPWRGVPGRRLTRPGARLHHRAQQGAWVASARWSGADSARAEGSTPLAPPTTRGRPPPHVALSHRTWPSFGACLIEERLQRLVWQPPWPDRECQPIRCFWCDVAGAGQQAERQRAVRRAWLALGPSTSGLPSHYLLAAGWPAAHPGIRRIEARLRRLRSSIAAVGSRTTKRVATARET